MDEDQPTLVRLRLYVSGDSPHTAAATRNVTELCDRLDAACDVEIVDVVDDPAAAERDHVLLTPTLVRQEPRPVLRVAGDLSDLDAALEGLALRSRTSVPPDPGTEEAP